MRLKPSICALFVVFWALTSAFAASAQEIQDGKITDEEMSGGMRIEPDPDPERNSKSTLSITGGGTSREVSRDSSQSVQPIQPKQVKPFKGIEKPGQEEEDPLSFNFLYYIIEKFKLSDIVE